MGTSKKQLTVLGERDVYPGLFSHWKTIGSGETSFGVVPACGFRADLSWCGASLWSVFSPSS